MINKRIDKAAISLIVAATLLVFGGCSGLPELRPATYEQEAPLYVIGPGDSISIFVWGSPELSTTATVRPDGRITTPLLEDVPATGYTPTELAREMEKRLSQYVRAPIVSVTVSGFVGRPTEQVRILGEATNPQSIPFHEHMTLLDVMIDVGGITEFAAGNRTVLVRRDKGKLKRYRVYLDDLLDGKIKANVDMLPGDILIIPEAIF